MGSLASRPAVPVSQPQVIFVPAPAAQSSAATTPANASSASDNTGSTGSDQISDAQSASEARASNLLQRSRGRLGTIQTSFRGLLGLASQNSQRKTLLGE